MATTTRAGAFIDQNEQTEFTGGWPMRKGLAAMTVAMGLALTACATAGVSNPPTSPSAPSGSSTPGTTASPTSSGAPTSSTATPTGATPSTATPSPSATPSTPTTLRSASLVFSGDLLWHNTLWKSAAEDRQKTGKGGEFDFDPMFAAIKPTIESADLAVCHEEVPFAKQGGPYTGYPSFSAPPAIAPWIKTMGWDACTLSSNHSIDGGFEGLVRTNKLLADNGVVPAGTFISQQARNTPVIVPTKNGIKVALIGSTYSLNGYELPKGKEFAVSMINVPDLLAQAKRAKAAGAEVVIVQLHGGEEYQTQPNAQQVSVAKALTASLDVDAVVGQHVHVVQPITKVNGKWVVYGMGNMVAQHLTSVPRGYEGITVRLNITENQGGGFTVETVDYIPTLVTHYTPGDPVRLYPVVSSLAAKKGPQERLKTALTRTRQAVLSLGKPQGLTER